MLGDKMIEWARQWTAYWTRDEGHFTMSAEEDAGVMQALMFLGAGGRADRNRLLDLGAASDLVEPPAGQSLIERLAAKAAGTPKSAYQEALETAYVGDSVVVKDLVAHWNHYRTTPPV